MLERYLGSDPKTTLTGIIGFILTMLAAFHVVVPAQLSTPEGIGGIVSTTLLILGIFSGDKKGTSNTGGFVKFWVLPALAILAVSGLLFFTGCAGSKANTVTTTVEISNASINTVAAQLEDMCQSGQISQANCSKIQVVYNRVRIADAAVLHIIRASIDAGTDPKSNPDYPAASAELAAATADLFQVAAQMGIIKGGVE